MKSIRWAHCLLPTLALLLNQILSYQCISKSHHNNTLVSQHHKTGRTISTKLVGDPQVRRVARNAANKLQLLNSRVDQIEAQIAEDQSLMTGNIINSTSYNNQPASEFSSPYVESTDGLNAAPNETNELIIQSAPQSDPQAQEPWNSASQGGQQADELPVGKLNNMNSSTSSERAWSKPIIKSVIPSPQSDASIRQVGQREESQLRQTDQAESGNEQDNNNDQVGEEGKTNELASSRSVDMDQNEDQPAPAAPVQQSSASLADKYAGSKSLPTLLASTWNSNQNFNYFTEQNLKNHGTRATDGHPQLSGYKLTNNRNKFQNMTVVNSERDLSNSFSSHSGPQYPANGGGSIQVASTSRPVLYENNRGSGSHLSTYSIASHNRQSQNPQPTYRNNTAINQRFNQIQHQQQQQQQQTNQQVEPIRWPVLAGPLEQPAYINNQPTSGSVISPMLAMPDGSQSDLLKHRISMSAASGGSEDSTGYPPVSLTTDPQSIGDAPPGFMASQSDQLESMINLQQQGMDRQESASSQAGVNYQTPAQNMGARIDEAQVNSGSGETGSSADEIQSSSYVGQQVPRYYSTGLEQQQSMNSQQMSGGGGSGISQTVIGADEQRQQVQQPQQSQLQSLNKIAAAMIAQNPVLAPLELATLIQRHQQQRLINTNGRQQPPTTQVTTPNPISRSYYITDTQPQTPASGYRRYSADTLASYLSRQAMNDQLSSSADMSPYSAATHFQPIYTGMDGRSLRSQQQQYYRAALAAAAATKAANEQALLAASSGLVSSPVPTSLFATAAANSPSVYESASLKSADDLPGPQPRLQQQQQQQQQAHHQQQQHQQQQSGSQVQSQYTGYKPRSYLNSLFKPTASSRYYYSPTLLSPISLAAPASLHSLYAPALGAADLAATLPQMAYSNPYAIHQSQLEQAQQYQAALAATAAAAAAAASGLQAHYIDPDMAESSLMPTDSTNFADPSSVSSSSSSSNEDSQPAQSSSSASSTKKSAAPWSSIAGLLLGVIPFGMIMAALMPVMAVTGRKKRELELGARNFAHLLQWRAPSKVLEALLGAASAQRRSGQANSTSDNLIANQHQLSKPRNSLDLISDNLILDQIGAPTNLTPSASSSSSHTIKSSMLKVLGSALNGLISATTQTMKRRQQTGSSEQQSNSQQQQLWMRIPALIKSSLKLDSLFNVSDYKRHLTTFRQRAMLQHQQPLQRSATDAGDRREDSLLAPVTTGSGSAAQLNATQSDQAPTPFNNHNNNSISNKSRGHLEICLNQFLCRLAVKLDKSFRLSSSSSASSTSSTGEPDKMELVTKKYINQLIDQIEAGIPNDMQQNLTTTTPPKPTSANKKSRSLLLDNLDNLYRVATKNQCSTAYSCLELLQLEKMLMKMHLKLN